MRNHLYSRSALTSLEDYLGGLPVPRAKAKSTSSASSSGTSTAVPPWAENMVEKQRRKKASSQVDQDQDIEDDDMDIDLSEDVLGDPEVMEQLAKFREAWQETEEQRSRDFQVSVLGGTWTAKHKGVVADAFSASARGEVAIAWCRARTLPRSARFELSLYGEANAAVLARAWCSKMQFMLHLCKKLGDDLHAFSLEEKADWPEPSELGIAERELMASKRAVARIAQIRNLW